MEPKREATCPANLFSLVRAACVRCRSIALRAVASAFTTQSANATLESVRDYLKGSPPPPPAKFAIGPGGSRAVFAVSSIRPLSGSRPFGQDGARTSA
jgi:hypothetical protein